MRADERTHASTQIICNKNISITRPRRAQQQHTAALTKLTHESDVVLVVAATVLIVLCCVCIAFGRRFWPDADAEQQHRV